MAKRTPEELQQAIENWYIDRGIKRRAAEERASKIVLKEQIAAKLETLPDDDAEAVIYLFDPWAVGVAYKADDVVQYQTAAYKVLQDHTSQADWTPDTAASLFTSLRNTGQGGGAPDEWVQPLGGHDVYMAGDRVTHNGQTWTSDVDNNSWEPGVYGWTADA